MKLIAIERLMRGLADSRNENADFRAAGFVGSYAADRSETSDAGHPKSGARGVKDLVDAKDAARHAAQMAMKTLAARRGVFEAAEVAQGSNVSRFLDWAKTASPGERANAARTLGRAYRCIDLPESLRADARAGLIPKLNNLRAEAEVCLTSLVDDEFPMVRRALAEALADAADAPRHIVNALANDQPEVAAIILARSPLLDDAELVEYASIGGVDVQIALAGRAYLSEHVTEFLARAERREVVLALIENTTANLGHASLCNIGDRFGEDVDVRDALLRRPELPTALRYDLFVAAATAFPHFAVAQIEEKRVARMLRDTLEQCAILVASSSNPDEVRDLVHHLRTMGLLTTALLVRAVVSGGRELFEAAGAELTGVSPARIAGFVREPYGSGFGALYRRMGLPPQFLLAFRSALAAPASPTNKDATRVSCSIVSRMISACENSDNMGPSSLIALLRRLEAEAVLWETRALAERRAATLLEEEVESIPSFASVEPASLRMLSLLHHLELDGAFSDMEVGPAASSLRWDAIGSPSLAA